jgi:hypothetical protein
MNDFDVVIRQHSLRGTPWRGIRAFRNYRGSLMLVRVE